MQTFQVGGMTCEHCVRAVSDAVGGVAGAEGVAVDLGTGLVSVNGSPEPGAVRAAIEEAGYTVEERG